MALVSIDAVCSCMGRRRRALHRKYQVIEDKVGALTARASFGDVLSRISEALAIDDH